MDSATKQKVAKGAGLVTLSAVTLGLIYGYDNGNIGGAALSFGPDLGLSTQQVEFVTAAIVWGEILGAVLGGWIANKVGRKKAIIAVAAGYLLFCLTSAISFNELSLAGSRFLLGLTIGLSLIAVPLFVAESVPAAVRGRTLVLYQVMGVIGIILGNVFSATLSEADSSYNWRIMLGIAAVPALLLLPMLAKLPETPNWLMLKGRRKEATANLERIDPAADFEAEIQEMQDTIDEESGGGIGEMFRKPFLRATVFVVTLGFFIQITGINATVTYGPQLFKSMGVDTDVEAIWMSAGVQVFALLAVLTSMRYIDRWGRRPILMTGIGIMTFGLLLSSGVSFAVGDGTFSTVEIVLGFAGLALVNIGFVFGFGSLVWVYASEAFPGRLRAYGTSAMLTSDLVANLIVASFTLSAIEAFGQQYVFIGFAVLAVLAFGFVFKYAPETKGRQLDDIRFFWENGGSWPADDADGVASGAKVH
ncbi:MAG: sugar porter family MFS transporter [Actinobacteria bacterium]|nr:sugar porter family MFS transporter [Actinomycetota bacterium]